MTIPNRIIKISQLEEATSISPDDLFHVVQDGINKKIPASFINLTSVGSGYSGFSGQSGYSGFSGTNGSIGSNGVSGFSGFSGVGVPGFSGFSGFSGLNGEFSASGFSGFSGRSGFSGTNGSIGVSGFSGFSGLGLSGFSGFSGATGTGTSGFSGFSGVSGFSGFSGNNGSIGVSGFSGFSGADGVGGQTGILDVSVFGALGDGVLHTLNSAEAAAINATFSVYGMQGASAAVSGDQLNWAIIQGCLYRGANTGENVYIPPGAYKMGSRTLRLSYTATPITGQPARPLIGVMYGAGHDSTQLSWGGMSANAVCIELLGESNVYSVRMRLAEFRVYQDETCDASCVCLRVGDCKESFSMYRVYLEGANGMLLKIASSSSYAQMCTNFVECKFDANYATQWTQTGGTFYAVQPDSGGALWDNVKWDSCEFGGLVWTRSNLAIFTNCQFFSNTRRATGYDGCLFAPLGAIRVRDCYFEDYLVAVVITNGISHFDTGVVDGCHFSSVVNDSGSPLPRYAVQVANFGVNKMGMITITNNRMNFLAYTEGVLGHHQGQVGSEGVDFYIPGTRCVVYNNSNIYDPYAPITVFDEGSYLLKFDGSDDPTTGLGRTTMFKATVQDVMLAGGVTVVTKDEGATANTLWGVSVQNPDNSDSYVNGISSTTYETSGGAIPWIQDGQVFEYIPVGMTKRWGIGLGTSYMQWSTTGLDLSDRDIISDNLKAGTGSPESVVTGKIGDVYRNTTGGVGTTLYVKEVGAGNTGWTAFAAGGGASGYSGFSGRSGFSGFSGFSGSGLSGFSGFSGASSVQSVVPLTDGSTISTDASLGAVYTVTISGNRQMLNPINSIAGKKILYQVRQDGVGNRTLSWETDFRFSVDIPVPTLSTSGGMTDYIGFIYNGISSKWDCLAFSKGY